MIKLIATDLDGTLFYPKRKFKLLTKKNRKFMIDYINQGNEVVLVSGRNYFISNRVKKRIKNDIDMIACNGSVIYKGDELIFDSPMDHKKVYDFYLENCKNKEILTWIFMTDKDNMIVVHNSLSSFLRVFYRIVLFFQFGYTGKCKFGKKRFKQMIENENARIYKVMAIYGLGKKATEKARIASKKFGEDLKNSFEVMWSTESIEFMNKGINKARALEKLIQELGIDKEEVAVIGDSGNDVPLFESFPNSFVMSHAHEEVKKKANVVIDSFYCLEKYIK
ncbi:MAG: HAD family hydrolase [Bacilli bacterium]|nr:Cof-type HAD-IIB family hydrolase [Acholeplasmataceae bacterium]MDY2903099.1 HAD family hydrolase [Bacilli bacterium]